MQRVRWTKVIIIQLLAIFLLLPFTAAAEELPTRFDPYYSVLENLAGFKGKQVKIYLANGTTIDGTVLEVGARTVHMESQPFFEYIVDPGAIVAIYARQPPKPKSN